MTDLKNKTVEEAALVLKRKLWALRAKKATGEDPAVICDELEHLIAAEYRAKVSR